MTRPKEERMVDMLAAAPFASPIPTFWQKVLGVPMVLPYYHVVSDESLPHIKHLYHYRNVREFSEDIDYLLRHYRPITLATFLQHIQESKPLPKSSFLLTFDDGFREIHDIIAPILLAKGVPATFFLTSGFLDNPALCHNEKSSLLREFVATSNGPVPSAEIHAALDAASVAPDPTLARLQKVTYLQRDVLDQIARLVGCDYAAFVARNKPYLTTDQVHHLLKWGFTIGAHSVDHPLYALLSLEEQLQQTRTSVREIKSRFGINYSAFAFPHYDTGVSDEFFRKLHSEGVMDVSFGTGGMLDDRTPLHFQRFTMEKTLLPARWILAKQFARRLSKKLRHQGTVSRDAKNLAAIS